MTSQTNTRRASRNADAVLAAFGRMDAAKSDNAFRRAFDAMTRAVPTTAEGIARAAEQHRNMLADFRAGDTVDLLALVRIETNIRRGTDLLLAA
ncbi:hypothetical protein BJ123_108134 [Rhodopseudomonas thermotolerans]|uniref:Uncharacterized protein n=2 Tax=Rhodopseudomonas TaxID=1073 RepID=A0A336JRN8_9BRAD|nr:MULTISPECIES: hypothetical protein [Rhodopseudomonas]RED36199.1 hypothetical protein BJ125_108134 [Rhodopseudomonas pentothenatexigens]REG03571.1 hypothetical protein BJ123_108134 [Rhodopseudomonas thermotolerans]SSW90759.1 hypothetical protein SAMN05892882_108134 [Rhodopseudomonas pentothenatexigens]